MKRAHWLIGAALGLSSAWAIAQDAPESLLPETFGEPAPSQNSSRSEPGPAQPTSDSGSREVSEPVIQPLPTDPGDTIPLPRVALPPGIRLPSAAELEELSPDELADVLGLRPKSDLPPSARRAMTQLGVLGEDEGGLPSSALVGQDASLVRAALAGNDGMLVSRWGHILLRRALASRLDAPAPMDPADFAALRAALLLRMGEGETARALVQDIDTGNQTPALTAAAFDAYLATADITGICPTVAIHASSRKDPQWTVARAICKAFEGDGANAMRDLDSALWHATMPKIDIYLAQKYAGAAGKSRRAVAIKWDDVKEMTPWRYGLTLAVGIDPPAPLMRDAGVRYDYLAATAPMLGLPTRAAAADRAAGAGILSSAAMVDLYSQIYAQDDIEGEWRERSEQLRNAYVADTPAERHAAIRQLWDAAPDESQRYSRQVLTAYAAARLPASEALADDAGPLIGSMLAAGLDANALRWAKVAEVGSEAWGLLALAAPRRSALVTAGALESFYDDDQSDGARKSAFLLAGLAGLGRVSPEVARDFAATLGVDLHRQTRWSQLIRQAAEVDNPALVALLAGVGMQGSGWDKMTPRHLYQIVAALREVGFDAEARMIAAEAVARG